MTWIPAVRWTAQRAVASVLAALLVAVLVTPAGQGTTATNDVPGSPVEHMARLQPFLGAYTIIMESGDQETRGTLEVRPVLGADYVEWKIASAGRAWRLRFLMTWDPGMGRYRIWRFDTRRLQPPGENEGVAPFIDGELVMEWSMPAPDGRPATFRNRTWMVSEDTLVIMNERELRDGEIRPLVRTTAHRLDAEAGDIAGAAPPHVTTAEVLLRPSVRPDHRIRFGAADHAFGDLRLPDGPGPHPVAVLVHGGCWLSFAGLRHFDGFAAALAERGLATWNVNYRKVDQPGGGWPGTFHDVAAGVDHVRELAVGHDLDLSRVVVIGHSAGGHLATWAAARSRVADSSPVHSDDPVPVAGVVNIAGPADLEALLPHDEQACGEKVIEPLVGGLPDEVPAQYAATSPVHLLPLTVPQLHLVGEEDPLRPFVEAFAARAETAGDVVALEIVAGAGHHDLIAPWSAWWSTVPDLILGSCGSCHDPV
jgi:acetyl esterase/lipase